MYPQPYSDNYAPDQSTSKNPHYAQVTPIDPFRPSVAYSIQNVSGAARPNRVSYDDIPLPPPPSQGPWYPPPRPPFGSRPQYYEYQPGRPNRPAFDPYLDYGQPSTQYPYPYQGQTHIGRNAPYRPYGPPPVKPQSIHNSHNDKREDTPSIHYYAPDGPNPYTQTSNKEESAHGHGAASIGDVESPRHSPKPVPSSKYSPTSPQYSPASLHSSIPPSDVHPEESQLPDSPITGASWPIDLVRHPQSPVLTTEKRSQSTIPQTIPEPLKPASPGMLIMAFLVDTLPRQIYLYMLLRLPSLYFSRVSRIFLEAEVTMPEIKQGILHDAQNLKTQTEWYPEPMLVSPSYQKLQSTWDGFIDSLLKEWKTLNIVSVLLLSAILTVLQLDGAAEDPLTRFSALISMICALMSLLFGCMYIIRFGMMRKAHKAAEWAQEAQQNQTGITWNVWIMLAMPAVWLAWSMISYIICIMAFVWNTGTSNDAGREVMSASDALAPRIVVSCILCLGLIYFILIASTLRRYGDLMDQAWQRRIQNWIYDQNAAGFGPGLAYQVQPPNQPPYDSAGYANKFAEKLNSESQSVRPPNVHKREVDTDYGYSKIRMPDRSINAPLPPGGAVDDIDSKPVASHIHPPYSSDELDKGSPGHFCMDDHTGDVPEDQYLRSSAHDAQPTETHPVDQAVDPVIELIRFCGLDSGDPEVSGASYDKVAPHESSLTQMGITKAEWEDAFKSLEAAWSPFDFTRLEKVLNLWNKTLLNPRGGQIRLCQEYGIPWNKYAVYYFDRPGRLPYDPGCFKSSYFVRLDIIGLFEPQGGQSSEAVSRRLSLFSPILVIEEQYLRPNDEDWRSLVSLRDEEDINQASLTIPPTPVSNGDEDKLDASRRDSKIE